MTAKPGQKTLASLDQYRYGAALDTFGSGNPAVAMGLEDVKTLVEWKLYVCFSSFSSARFLDVIPPSPQPGSLGMRIGDASRKILRHAAALIEQALWSPLYPLSHQLADRLSVDTGSLGPP